MMVSPKSVVADAAEENNRDCSSDGGCVPNAIPSLVEARPESTPVRRPLLFVLTATLTHNRRRVLEAVCLKRLPTDDVDGRFDRRESSGADMVGYFRRAAERCSAVPVRGRRCCLCF